ncbi:hypothetical protein KR200_010821, partial [Drosophila serrata]
CHSDTIVTGDCGRRIRGFAYISGSDKCHRFRTRACSVTGNFFHSEDECKQRCATPRSSNSDESGFVSFINRSMARIQDLLKGIVNYASE